MVPLHQAQGPLQGLDVLWDMKISHCYGLFWVNFHPSSWGQCVPETLGQVLG